MASINRLNLKAEDAEDLQIVSAALQDALMRAGDTRFDSKLRVFTAVFNRYRWEDLAQIGAKKGQTAKTGAKTPGARIRSGLSFAGVLKVQAQNLKRAPRDAVAQLLTIRFEPSQETENPGGDVVMEFAAGGRLRLSVECLDVLLADVSEPWRARGRPDHDGDEP